ncbi:helix-turn-helix transcriptional regulator [Mammaliicoccus sciuri]|uniref:helix-turn-helix domain-containing protein n=1 Tax=Mammaliicoccus sciuri TaxID=1296 RepID=UPI0021CF053A|nr:helix-turn-helix transcriptional regulator [Mammaliicoccus sciuri]UXU79292.1 helix-turn-helix transcriptional regulator [Mammaliicoccus sciuri]
MSVKWKLRNMMAKNEIWTGTELQKKIVDITGYSISLPSITALINDPPKMIRVETLDALCTTLNCTPNDLIEHEKNYIGKKTTKEKISRVSTEQRSLPPI